MAYAEWKQFPWDVAVMLLFMPSVAAENPCSQQAVQALTVEFGILFNIKSWNSCWMSENILLSFAQLWNFSVSKPDMNNQNISRLREQNVPKEITQNLKSHKKIGHFVAYYVSSCKFTSLFFSHSLKTSLFQEQLANAFTKRLWMSN